MADLVVCCTDGSELSINALRRGLAALADSPGDVVLVMSVPEPDPTMVTGAGFAGPVMSVEQFDLERQHAISAGETILAEAVVALGRPDVSTKVLTGLPGQSVCQYAADEGARLIIVGTRGRGGFVRAMMGSVSDYIVRHSPCPVLVCGQARD